VTECALPVPLLGSSDQRSVDLQLPRHAAPDANGHPTDPQVASILAARQALRTVDRSPGRRYRSCAKSQVARAAICRGLGLWWIRQRNAARVLWNSISLDAWTHAWQLWLSGRRLPGVNSRCPSCPPTGVSPLRWCYQSVSSRAAVPFDS